jgi:hypothetical protein
VLWQAVATGTTRDALLDLLVDRYGLGPEEAAAHVDDFVSALGRSGVLATP